MLCRVVLVVLFGLLALTATGCAPGQAEVENAIRTEMKAKMGVVIKSVDLKKQSDGSFIGTATAENGDVYDVTTTAPKGNLLEWKATFGQALVEKAVRAEIEKRMGSKVKTLQLNKHGPGNYSGRAELESGVKMTVTTRLDGTQLLMETKPETP
jgi:hypothetical protein